jgi:rsbT co-antagonist protein RsbR
MSTRTKEGLAEVVARAEAELLPDWMRHQLAATTMRRDLIHEDVLREQSSKFLSLFQDALRRNAGTDVQAEGWKDLRTFLAETSAWRARQGFSPSETATFVLSFKQPLFDRLREAFASDPERFADETWSTTVLLDNLALITTEAFQKGREEVIFRQQQEMLELSTPVVELWEGILALPVIGTLDSARTQVVMENLLSRIVETGAEIAIIDITGVPTVDTLVAQHLLKTVAAARLMGAECIISGIRPQIAQTIVHLGVDLQDVITKATLADAFAIALRRSGLGVAALAPNTK